MGLPLPLPLLLMIEGVHCSPVRHRFSFCGRRFFGDCFLFYLRAAVAASARSRCKSAEARALSSAGALALLQLAQAAKPKYANYDAERGVGYWRLRASAPAGSRGDALESVTARAVKKGEMVAEPWPAA